MQLTGASEDDMASVSRGKRREFSAAAIDEAVAPAPSAAPVARGLVAAAVPLNPATQIPGGKTGQRSARANDQAADRGGADLQPEAHVARRAAPEHPLQGYIDEASGSRI